MLAVLALSLLVEGAFNPPSTRSADVKPISEKRLKEILVGSKVIVRSKNPPPIRYFRSDGLFNVQSDVASIIGRYRINKNRVCIDFPGQVECIDFYENSKKGYYMKHINQSAYVQIYIEKTK